MQLPLILDRSHSTALTAQIVEQLREAILQGRIAPGARMPSSRQLADQLGVSRNTVVRAYEWLTVESFVETRPASGVFAAVRLPDPRPRPMAPLAPVPQIAAAPVMPMPFVRHRAPRLASDNASRLTADFFPGRPSPALFPLKIWRRLMQSALSHGGISGLTHYPDPAGLAALRTAIASHVASARGIVADVNRVIIVSGIQEGINIAARLFLHRGAVGVVENPCYQGARFAFEATGAELVGVPVDRDGLLTDALPTEPAALAYVTPSHQFPAGHTLSMTRRHALIGWARDNGCYIVEDDYDADFRYDGSPLPSVASLAPDCTIYLGTFSKSLGAGLRLGYMIVPERLADSARTEKALLNNGNPWLDQAVLAELIRSGSYASHLTRARARYRESRDALLVALRKEFGQLDVTGQDGGLHVCWKLPPGVPDADVLEGIARRARIGVYALSSAGAYDQDETSELARRSIVFGYASLLPRQITQSIARLSQAIDDALELPSTDAMSRPRTAPHLAPAFAHQPALLARPSRRATSRHDDVMGNKPPMPIVTGIYRYPIKGLSAQPLTRIALAPDQPFPNDRIFALARPNSPIDLQETKWAKKGSFVMLMLDEALASVRTQLNVDNLDFSVMDGESVALNVNLASPHGREELEAFFQRLVPSLKGTPHLVRAHHGHFMDKPDPVVSLINLATVRQLEEMWGFEIDPLRFRANFYIDGAEPWEEFDWVGRDIVLGSTLFRVDRKNGRCGATNVNPVNGRRDLDIPGSLRGAFGHKDLGIYLLTRKSGEVALGSEVKAPRMDAAARAAPLAPIMHANGHRSLKRSFICRGCYYIYSEADGAPKIGIPAGTGFGDLSATWRCPDCGTEKGNFRPYVARD